MSTTQPTPNGFFLAAWTLWFAGVLYGHATVDTLPLWSLGWLIGFFNFEVLALLTNWHWTLSAVVTWVVRSLSKHDLDVTGWNWLVDIVALPIALLVARVAHQLAGGWEGWALGFSLAIPLAAMLHQHWLHPERHG